MGRKPKTPARLTLKDLLPNEPFIYTLIDDEIEMDENGNYLINVGYTRVSTDQQADLGFGLDVQRKDVFAYAKNNQFKNLVLFVDDGYTGTSMDRPALCCIKEMIVDFNEKRSNVRINTFIVPRIDRLGRTLLGTLQFIQEYILAKKGSGWEREEDINFVSVAESYCRIERNNPQGKFLLMLFASLAEYDRDMILEKMNKGRLSRFEAGKPLGGGNSPFGYKYSRSEQRYVIVPEEAEKVKEIFRLYIDERLSPIKIATRLGISSSSIVWNALHRKLYTGCIVYNGIEYQAAHEPIIPLSVWDEAQEVMRSRQSSHKGNHTHLLSGLLYCGECGNRMRYQISNRNGDTKIICYAAHKGNFDPVRRYKMSGDKLCDNKSIWSRDVEKKVVHALLSPDDILLKAIKKKTFHYDPTASLLQELKKETRKLDSLYEVAEDVGYDDVLREKIQTTRHRIVKLQTELDDTTKKERDKKRFDGMVHILRTLNDTWEYMTDKEQHQVMLDLIDSITIHKSGDVYVKLKLESYIEKQSKSNPKKT